MRRSVAWDATHPTMFFAAFATGLSVNVGAMADSVWRFKHNPDAQERRRLSLAVMTAAIGTLAFIIKDGCRPSSLALGRHAVRLAVVVQRCRST